MDRAPLSLPEEPAFMRLPEDYLPPFFFAGGVALLAGLLLGEFWNRIERIWVGK